MPEIDHNAPGFKYRVYYRRAIPGVPFTPVDITNWRTNRLVVDGQESYVQYEIKVSAMNDVGEANVSPNIVIGYSGENEPLEAPSNFKLKRIDSATTAWLSWDPVPLESIRGHMKGYKIKIWTERKDQVNEIQVQGGDSNTLVKNFVPFTKNYAQVYVYNSQYNGPPSNTLSFEMPEGLPDPVRSLEAHPWGQANASFWLIWNKPLKINGILQGYRIYYSEANDTSMRKISRNRPINNPDQLTAKLAGLKAGTKYRIYVAAVTGGGEGEP